MPVDGTELERKYQDWTKLFVLSYTSHSKKKELHTITPLSPNAFMKYFHEMHILKLYQILNNEFISFYKFVSHNKEEQYEKITPDSYLSLYCRYVEMWIYILST